MDNNATLRAKIATLSAENRKLRRVAKYSRQDALLERIKVDAQQLLVWRFSGLSISRRNAVEMGMSRRRWSWARALLQHARIHDDQDVTAADFDGALAALDASINYLSKAGLESLRIRLPQNIATEAHRKRAERASQTAAQTKGQTGVQTAAQTHVQIWPNSRENGASGAVISRGSHRDRRAEIEARMMKMEATR